MSGITKLHLVSAFSYHALPLVPVSLARFVNLWGSPFRRLCEAVREECSSVLPSNWIEFELKKNPSIKFVGFSRAALKTFFVCP